MRRITRDMELLEKSRQQSFYKAAFEQSKTCLSSRDCLNILNIEDTYLSISLYVSSCI
jgi:hypothetical protein